MKEADEVLFWRVFWQSVVVSGQTKPQALMTALGYLSTQATKWVRDSEFDPRVDEANIPAFVETLGIEDRARDYGVL